MADLAPSPLFCVKIAEGRKTGRASNPSSPPPYNMLNWPQNAGNHFSDDLKFIIIIFFFSGKHAPDPLLGPDFGAQYLKLPFLNPISAPDEVEISIAGVAITVLDDLEIKDKKLMSFYMHA